MTLIRFLTALLAALCVAPGVAFSEQSERHGDFEIHYNAIPTTWLSPEVAERYGIPRSRVQGMLLVSVMEHDTPVTASVRGQTRDSDDPARDMDFRRLAIGERTSQVALFPIRDGATMQFELVVRPRMQDESYSIRFRETFHVE